MTQIVEMGRYFAKGAATTLLNIGLMTALVEFGGVGPALAAVLSTCVLLVLGYALMNRFVFPDAETPTSRRGHVRRGLQYYGVILSGKGVNYLLFLGLLSLDVWYPLAWVLGSATVFFGTYSANRWLWHREVAA